jgi:PAS domain S-box-containing protein
VENGSVYLSLIQNAALLVALSTLYGLLARLRKDDGPRSRLLSGVLFGAVAVAGMLLPFRYQPGIIYDGRSIILAMAGLFGGGIGSLVSIVLAGAYRVYLGGSGVWAGLATIVVCPMVGLAFRRACQNRPEKLGLFPLYLLGLSAHAAMLVCQLLFLPRSRSLSVVSHIWLPIILIFPVATVFIGLLLGNEERRIQTARALRESNDRFNRLVSQLGAVVWTASADGKTVKDVNQAFEDIYGVPADGLKAEPDLWLKMTHPDDRHLAEKSGEDLRTLGQTQVDYRIIRPNGEIRWLRDRKSMIYEKGKPIGMGGLAADITESKQIEQELLRNEQRLSSIYSTVGDAIFQVAVESEDHYRFSSVNAAFCSVTGLLPEALVGKSVGDVIPEPSLTLVLGKYRQAIEQRALVRWEETSDYPAGRLIGDVSVAPIFDAAGHCTHLVGSVHDVTERKRAEDALRKSEENMRYIIKHDPSAIAIFDRDLRYIAVSDRYFRDYELLDEDIVGKHHYEVFPEIPQKWREVHQRVLAGAIERGKDDTFVRLDGSLNYNNWECRPWYEPDGSIGGIVTYTEVTTERKRAEKALHERDEQLRQSQKMEAVGQLAGGIAHDFNNLLTAISGYSELLLARSDLADQSMRDDLNEIKHATERAAALTRQILAFSSRQALRPEIVCLNTVLLGMQPLLKRTLGEEIDLTASLDPDLGQTEVDVNQFEQVLMNLAVNARDAMLLGGRLTLETANVELDEGHCGAHPDVKPGDYVRLTVSDAGLGMDEETMSHIFEPFYTTKAPGKGTGLGLSTVYGIIRQSGGSIDVHSTPGQGSVFEIHLPRVLQPASPAPSPAQVVSSSTGGRETILVVEDEESLRSLTARVLGELGYTVLSAGTAPEALELLGANDSSVDLLLTDVVLPGGMRGHELAEVLESFRPDLRVLYMSGYSRNAIVHAGRLDEGVNFLEKPFTPEALARTVRRVLDRPRPQ